MFTDGYNAQNIEHSAMTNITNLEAFKLEATTVLAAAYSAFPMPFAWTHDTDSKGYPMGPVPILPKAP